LWQDRRELAFPLQALEYSNSMQNFFLFVIAFLLSISSFSQEIALTFDDAPLSDGSMFTGMQRTSRIIETLKTHQVKQAAFFVVTSQINSDGLQRLKMYSDAGHLLANHSHSHNSIGGLGTANYIRDIQKADSILKTTKLTYQLERKHPATPSALRSIPFRS
jgi:peptidoglycan-N-acetylglucosamine deacetylase